MSEGEQSRNRDYDCHSKDTKGTSKTNSRQRLTPLGWFHRLEEVSDVSDSLSLLPSPAVEIHPKIGVTCQQEQVGKKGNQKLGWFDNLENASLLSPAVVVFKCDRCQYIFKNKYALLSHPVNGYACSARRTGKKKKKTRTQLNGAQSLAIAKKFVELVYLGFTQQKAASRLGYRFGQCTRWMQYHNLKWNPSENIESTLRRFGFEGAKPASTPGDPAKKYTNLPDVPLSTEETSYVKDFPYREVIGCHKLSYVRCMHASQGATCAATVGFLARVMSNPKPVHVEGAKRCLRYLKRHSKFCHRLSQSKRCKTAHGICR